MAERRMTVTTAVSPAFGQLRCDQDMQALLQTFESLRPAVPDRRTNPAVLRLRPGIAEAVRLLRQQRPALQSPVTVPEPDCHDIRVPGADGMLRARVFTPPGTGPSPLVLFFHGGGWVTGSIDAADDGARGIAARAGAVVVSMDYRLAPEHRFPAAWEDALAAYRWVLDNAGSLRGDCSRIALAGEEAGGTLALATSLRARDAGLHVPAHVLAISPVTQTSTNTPSYLENAVTRPLGRGTMAWYFDKLVARRDELQDPRLQLIDADLTGMPPVTLVTARMDPLRTDAQRLMDALVRVGVPVQWREFQGVTHGFFGAAAVVAKAREAQAYAGSRLADALAAPVPAMGWSARAGRLADAILQLLPAAQPGAPAKEASSWRMPAGSRTAAP